MRTSLSMDFTARPSPSLPAAHELAALLADAGRLRQAHAAGHVVPQLLGKHLALLCAIDTHPDAALFRSAATALGAQVSHIVPQFAMAVALHDMQRTARMFGQLYDAVECQGVPSDRVQQLSLSAGVPVFDGLATAGHALAHIDVSPLGAVPSVDARRYLVQAVLLACLL